MTVQELFNFIVDQSVTTENRDEYLEHMKDVAAGRPLGQLTNEEKLEEEVFKNVYIPKTLDQVRLYSAVSKVLYWTAVFLPYVKF